MGTVQSKDVGASAHNVVNDAAFLAFTLCSLVASKCPVVLPRGSCESYGLFFYYRFVPPPLSAHFICHGLSLGFGKKHNAKGAVGLLCNIGKH